MPQIVIIGEAMLELSHPGGKGTRLAFGGDTLNTAIYLARSDLAPHYVTALGIDPYSDRLIENWEHEGVQTGHVLRHATRLPGLYAIQTDHRGERTFHYWRDQSAARAFFELEQHEPALSFAESADILYLTGITLSIFDEAGRTKLVETARAVRARGGIVAFDPNYRPRGWLSAHAAWEAMMPFVEQTSLALPTIDDENALHGEAPAETHAARWRSLGVQQVVMKCGPQGAIIFDGDMPPQHVPVQTVVSPTDTTGAGDSFNAGVLGALAQGHSLAEAVRAGNALASYVVQHPGAIAPRR